MDASFSAEILAIEALFSADCFYGTPMMPVFRFWLVTVGGSNISLVSVIENIFLIYLFSRPAHRQGPNLYMLLLAIFDLFVSFSYILLMSLNVLTDYLYYLNYFLLGPRLLRFWFTYAAPMSTLSHIAMSSSSFLIIAASLERYFLATKSPKLIFVQKYRMMIALAAILLGVVSKLSIYWELDIQHHTNCTGQMTEWQLDYASFVHGTVYHSIVRFWFRTIVTFVVTLIILIYLNSRILVAQKDTDASRSAKYSFIAVVCCNIASNVANVILGVGENFAKEIIRNHPTLYAVTVDFASLAITFICCLRLPIYLMCQTPLSEEILGIFRNWFKCNKDTISSHDNDEENGISDTTNDTVTKSDESDQRLLDVSSSQRNNGTPQDEPEANITVHQHSPPQSTFPNTNGDSSAETTFIEKTGEYEDELHKLLRTATETLV